MLNFASSFAGRDVVAPALVSMATASSAPAARKAAPRIVKRPERGVLAIPRATDLRQAVNTHHRDQVLAAKASLDRLANR